jgi:hydroxypyruvate isomerase
MGSNQFSRRAALKAGLAATAALTPLSERLSAQPAPGATKKRIRQSVCRWCYQQIPLDQLCTAAAGMGLFGIDLLNPDEYEIPRRYGMICTMAYADGGTIADGLNRLEHHAAIEAGFRTNIPLAAKAGVPNVITFSGTRRGMSDEEGARNTVIGLNRVKKIAEDNGVTICIELLNSKVNHPDYMADHTAWGVGVIDTITKNIQWMGHFHTGGVPGRHELNDTQEVQWDGVMRAIAGTPFKDYVAHEFLPTGDPLTSLRQAVVLCDV